MNLVSVIPKFVPCNALRIYITGPCYSMKDSISVKIGQDKYGTGTVIVQVSTVTCSFNKAVVTILDLKTSVNIHLKTILTEILRSAYYANTGRIIQGLRKNPYRISQLLKISKMLKNQVKNGTLGHL